MPSNRKSAFFKAVGEAQEQGTEPPKLTLPDRKVPSSPPEGQNVRTSERENARIPDFQNATADTLDQTQPDIVQNSRIPARQNVRGPERQIVGTPTFKRSKPPAKPKTNADGWEQQTTYLPPDLRQWLRIYALSTNQEISEIIAIALQEYRIRQQRG